MPGPSSCDITIMITVDPRLLGGWTPDCYSEVHKSLHMLLHIWIWRLEIRLTMPVGTWSAWRMKGQIQWDPKVFHSLLVRDQADHTSWYMVSLEAQGTDTLGSWTVLQSPCERSSWPCQLVHGQSGGSRYRYTGILDCFTVSLWEIKLTMPVGTWSAWRLKVQIHWDPRLFHSLPMRDQADHASWYMVSLEAQGTYALGF